LIKRDFAKAQEMLDTGLGFGPDQAELLADQGVLYAYTNKRREAEELMEAITTNRKISEDGKRIGLLYIHAALGNLDEAFAILMKQAETHAWPTLIKSEPVFEQIRKDPRFSDFCRKVGLPV
jgi:tetratricopeptide (TPR) repeat protein